MLLLHLAYSEEDLKFKAEIPPFPEAQNHKSQCAPVYHWQGELECLFPFWRVGEPEGFIHPTFTSGG